MSSITELKPACVWTFFAQICTIPRPSKHEAALCDYIIEWAKKSALEVEQDPTGNLLIKKPARDPSKPRQTIALQAHLDMVPQKNSGIEHDFLRDPIRPVIEGDWVTAVDTTLGADNGMGLAACLAVLDSTDIDHGPIEVLLTVDEEAGMTGATKLKPGWLKATALINTDSEQEGEVFVGCAGGANCYAELTLDYEPAPAHLQAKRVSIRGLRGGHSGCDIHTGRASANELLARFCYQHRAQLRLIDLHGGSLRNAIARESQADILVSDPASLEQAVAQFHNVLKRELGSCEPTLEILIEDIPAPTQVPCHAHSQQLISALHLAPHGVQRMSDDFPGVVETSLNFALIRRSEKTFTLSWLVRSLSDSTAENLISKLEALCHSINASFRVDGAYPGWKPDPSSRLLQNYLTVFAQLYGHKPQVQVIHAGLECGLFKKSYPQMDMISFGPTIKYPHSPDEKVEIETVDKFWAQLCALLESCE